MGRRALVLLLALLLALLALAAPATARRGTAPAGRRGAAPLDEDGLPQAAVGAASRDARASRAVHVAGDEDDEEEDGDEEEDNYEILPSDTLTGWGMLYAITHAFLGLLVVLPVGIVALLVGALWLGWDAISWAVGMATGASRQPDTAGAQRESKKDR